MPPENSHGNTGAGPAHNPEKSRERTQYDKGVERVDGVARRPTPANTPPPQDEEAENDKRAQEMSRRAFLAVAAEREARVRAINLAQKKEKIGGTGAAKKKLGGAGFWMVFALAVIADLVPILAILVTAGFAHEAAQIGGTVAKTIQIISGIVNILLAPTGPVAAAIYVVRHYLLKQVEKFLVQKAAEAVFILVFSLMSAFLFLSNAVVVGIVAYYLMSHGVLMTRSIVGRITAGFLIKLIPGINLLPSLSVSLWLIRRRVNKEGATKTIPFPRPHLSALAGK